MKTKEEYISAIVELLTKCDAPLLDLIWKLLCKSI